MRGRWRGTRFRGGDCMDGQDGFWVIFSTPGSRGGIANRSVAPLSLCERGVRCQTTSFGRMLSGMHPVAPSLWIRHFAGMTKWRAVRRDDEGSMESEV